jgi:hypothetical protein
VLADLQGNILKGHGRDHTIQLFLRFKSGAAAIGQAKSWISRFAASAVTSAKRQFDERDDFQHGFVTLKGGEYFFAPSLTSLRKLGTGGRTSTFRFAKVMDVVAQPRTDATKRLYAAYWGAGEALAPGLPPTPAKDLIRHGGRTIPRISFANLYVAGKSAWTDADATNIDGALTKAMQDARLNDVLKQYFNGTSLDARFLGQVRLPGAAPKLVTRGDLERMIFTLRKSGQLNATDLDSTVFNFLLPKGTVLTTDDAPSSQLVKGRQRGEKGKSGTSVGHAVDRVSSKDGLGGYHGSVTVGTKRIYYAVGVFSQDGNGIDAFGTPWKNVVATFYHELCEARTDPDVEEANRSGDPGLLGWTSADGEEIGDFPIFEDPKLTHVFKEIPLADGTGTVPIQFMYSNAVHGPEGPAD